ncbi:MAG TPA: hypothetical protein VNN73_02400 [Blastocatellia bacterium]|nr:hypothetical protein [Blastocatellia bacterium]
MSAIRSKGGSHNACGYHYEFCADCRAALGRARYDAGAKPHRRPRHIDRESSYRRRARLSTKRRLLTHKERRQELFPSAQAKIERQTLVNLPCILNEESLITAVDVAGTSEIINVVVAEGSATTVVGFDPSEEEVEAAT